MDGNIKDTPPIVFVPAAEDRDALGRRRRPSWPTPARPIDARKAGGPRRVRQVAAPPAERSPTSPRRLRLMPRREGAASADRRRLARATRRRQLDAGTSGAGVQPAGVARESPTPATSRRTRRSPTAPGSSSRSRGRPARSSPAWTTSTTTAAGTSGSRTASVGDAHRQQVARRRAQGRRSRRAAQPSAWTHVFVTYDGSAQGRRA